MGLFGNSTKAESITIVGHKLICPICGGDHFYYRSTQLNTAGMTFLGLDWANDNADNYFCAQCGYMFWFYPVE